MAKDMHPNSLKNLVVPHARRGAGRKKGSPNRNTIAQKVLSTKIECPEEIYKKLLPYYPKMKKVQTVEFIATLVQMVKAMNGDTRAYQAVLDSAYGQAKQQIEEITPQMEIIEIEYVNAETETDEQDQKKD